MPTTVSVDRVVEAWELYCSGAYSQILELESSAGDLADLRYLAGLEIESEQPPAPAGKGTFSELRNGMSAYHAGDFETAARFLGAWLKRKAYFNPLCLERFLEAAEASQNYAALYKIGTAFMDRKQYHALLVGPLFRAAFALEQYAVCGALFDKHRKHFADQHLLQRTALALLFLNRHEEAEKILMTIYRKLTGRAYALDYDATAAEYAPIIQQIPSLEKRKRNPREDWELGMAYLFNQQFDRAMAVFRSIQKAAA